MRNKIDISFFVPCLNEEKNIFQTLKNIKIVLESYMLRYEILVCDDHSNDNTLKETERFRTKYPKVNVAIIKNKYTKGLGRNYIDCSFLAKGKYYMLVNGDNAEPKKTLKKILNEIGSADIIIPYFAELDKRKYRRKFTSKLFTFLVNLLSGLKIPYYNGPAIHLTYNVMRFSPDTHGYAYQAELITRVIMEKSSYKTVKIINTDREFGSTSAFTFRNILSVLHSLLQIFLRRLRNYLFYNN